MNKINRFVPYSGYPEERCPKCEGSTRQPHRRWPSCPLCNPESYNQWLEWFRDQHPGYQLIRENAADSVHMVIYGSRAKDKTRYLYDLIHTKEEREKLPIEY